MVIRTLLPLLCLIWSCGHAQAMQRCVDKAGKISYSDQECPSDHKSRGVDLSGAGQAPPRPVASGRDSADATQDAPANRPSDDRLKSMKNYLVGAERDRKRDSLAVDLRNAEGALGNLQRAMDAELARLRGSKSYANNNLAGATWEASLSQEMSAITQRYDIKIRLAAERAERFRSELAALD